MMRITETRKVANTLSELLDVVDKQGYNAQTDREPDYDKLMLIELGVLEAISSKYKSELVSLSKCIRRFLWQTGVNGNSKKLYKILHRSNLTMSVLAGLLTEDVFWNLDMIIEYVVILHKHRDLYAPHVETQVFESIIDRIQMANAQETIQRQWADVLSAPDGLKAFMDIFDDIFTNALTKYEDLFFHEMSNEDILCRMVRERDCDENRFIPRPECTSQNRWNPPGRSFLYMSFGEEEHPYNEYLTLEEYVCLLECRTEIDTHCSFCRFEPTTNGRVLDLSYNDSQLSSFRQLVQRHTDELSKKGIEELLSDPEVFSRKEDEEYIIHRIEKIRSRLPISDKVVTESVAKQYLKLICSAVYVKVDGTEEEKKTAYRPFHILCAYLESKGVTGIIYPCTRSDRIIGKNVVLFDPCDARPVAGTIKKYYYAG